MNAPIVLFAYNRPLHTRRVLESLARNPEAKDSDLMVFIDALDESLAINRDIVLEVFPFLGKFKSVKVVYPDRHYGCKRSVIRGMDIVFGRYDRAIVLEDDIVVAPDFLKYMNEGLDYHEGSSYVFSITGSCPPVKTGESDAFLYPRFWSHGWATWKNRWNIDWNASGKFERGGRDQNRMLKRANKGLIDSWAIYVAYASKDRFTVFPKHNKCRNIGFDGSGTNTGKSDKWDNELSDKPVRHGNPVYDKDIEKQIDKMFKRWWQL